MKQMNQRQQRLAEVVRGAIAEQLAGGRIHGLTHISTPITITDVWVSIDFAHAKVFFTCSDDSKADEIKQILNASAPELQHILKKQLNTRYTPKPSFVVDETFARGAKMDAILDRLKKAK